MAWSPEWPGRVKGKPWTVAHFKRWTSQAVYEDEMPHDLEDWQVDVFKDFLAGFEEVWLVIPQGNSKTTFLSLFGLYHLDNTRSPWVPVGASSRDQAEILFGQALGFVERTRTCVHYGEAVVSHRCDVCGRPTWEWDRNENDEAPFKTAGTRQIKHAYNGGRGMKVYAADSDTADGVIPTLSMLDEGHRMKDLSLYRTWHGKRRKRRSQTGMISTAGVPGSDFEMTRDAMRDAAIDVKRRGRCYGRYATETTVLHEFAVPTVDLVRDIAVVKEANPLSTIRRSDLAAALASPTLDFGEDWLRLTCNIPARSSKAAVNELDWLRARPKDAASRIIPKGARVAVGADFAWILDTTSLVPFWVRDSRFRLLGPASILVPPRDGNMLDVQIVKDAFLEINERNPITLVVMDKSKAEDTAQWLVDELGVEVVDRTQGNADAVEDYDAFMKGLREGWLKQSGDKGLTTHVMNAIAAKRPGDKYRFDRITPSRAKAKQDGRVIDALSAAAMVNQVIDAGMGNVDAVPLVAVGRR